MAQGRRKEARTLVAQQAALVWLLTGEGGVDLETFIERGTLATGGKVNFSRADVIERIEQIKRDGKLIV